ncbi:MAG: hypothetical protein ABSF95_15810 [Verrucomicrobiota bacterium]|jgi:hypothetical protein
MKIEEVRQHLEGLNADDLRLVAAQLYRMLPKVVAEAKGADHLLVDLQGFLKSAKVRKAPILPDLGSVEFETSEFLEHASKQRYFAPNRIIPKSERGQWRFVARQLYKDWCLLAAQPENLAPAAKALEGLYRILCRGCEVYLFPSTDTFRAIGVPQPEFLEHLLLLKTQVCPPDQWISQALSLMRAGAHGDTLWAHLEDVFINLLKTPELKEAALLEITRQLQKATMGADGKTPQPPWEMGHNRHNLLRMGFHTTWALGEKERALQWVRRHVSREEDAGHLLLGFLLETKDRDSWVREYEAQRLSQPSVAAEWDKTYEQAKLQRELPGWQVR